jgi:glycosyltransferase involved in cell wall biosynthesis
MKVVIIARTSLFTSTGGDTVQVLNTVKHLEKLGVTADIRLTSDSINYDEYDLMHFFSLIRPSDIMPHIRKSKKPFVVTPLLIDYSEYDRRFRKGISGKIFRFFSADQIEYLKTIARWAKGQQNLGSYTYLLNGQRRGIVDILTKATLLLPNSQLEYDRLIRSYPVVPAYQIVPNGIDPELFQSSALEAKDESMVLCVARIEGLKNQVNLVKALNDTRYQLYIIGNPAINQPKYYKECQRIASGNVHFIGHLTQNELIPYYKKAKVHVLPSWFETCGLSSLEAAAMGCNIVITDKGYASEYFQSDAFYCDPGSTDSIREVIAVACATTARERLRKKMLSHFTWENAAIKTKSAYFKTVQV